jgi:hypothetical protein
VRGLRVTVAGDSTLSPVHSLSPLEPLSGGIPSVSHRLRTAPRTVINPAPETHLR